MTSDGRPGRPLARRALALQLLLAALVVLAANVGVAFAARNTLPRQARNRLRHATGVTDLFIGNSLIVAGVDEGEYERALPGAVALDAGLGFTFAVEHYLLELAYRGRAPRRVVYGYFDDQLTDEPHARMSELRANRTILFFENPDTAALYLYPRDRLARAQFRALAHVPLYVERGAVWERVEWIRRRLAAVGRPPEPTNRFGRARDFAFLTERAEWFAGRLRAAPSVTCPLSPALTSLFVHARARGSEVVVVRMPARAEHRARFHGTPEWRAYEACVRARLAEAGVTRHVDATAWVADDGFMDPVHLGPAGARIFSRRLAAEVVGAAPAAGQP